MELKIEGDAQKGASPDSFCGDPYFRKHQWWKAVLGVDLKIMKTLFLVEL